MKYLVFSEQYRNGVLMTRIQYQTHLVTMTHEDFETHVKVDVAEDAQEVLELARPKLTDLTKTH